MPEYSQELLSVIAQRGGLQLSNHTDAWLNKLVAESKAAIDWQRRRIEYIYFAPNGYRLHSAIYNCDDPRAFAYVSPKDADHKCAFIGISSGFVYNAACLVTLMLSRNDMFVEVGAASLEGDGTPLPYIPSNFAGSDIIPSMPTCDVRKNFSIIFLVKFIESVFMHEVSHLVRGHVGYVRASGILSWSEGAEEVEGLSSISKQALEFDADIGAIQECFNYLFLIQERLSEGRLNFSIPSIRDAWVSLNSNSIDAARYLFISMYMPLRMFEADSWAMSLQKPRSHPAPPVRMMYLIYVFSSEVLSGEIFNIDPELAKDYVLGWALECEESYMRLQGSEIDPRGLVSVWNSPEITDYIERIQEECARMEPELDTFSFNSPY